MKNLNRILTLNRISLLCLAPLLFAPFGASTSLATTVTETFDSYANTTVITNIGGGGVWTSGQNTVVSGGGVNGTAGLSTGSPIFNWKGQPFQWSTLINGAKVAMSLDFQSSTAGKFDDDRVGWTVDADSSTSTANQFALQLDTPEGGMTVYWNGTRTVLNALIGIKTNTWYRFNVEFTKLGVTNASIVGTLTELDASGNSTGTPYVGTVTNTATFVNPPDPARFTSTFQWPSFKNYNAVDGNADNATFTYTNSSPQPLTVGFTSPANNATVGTNFTINATVAGGGGTVTNVFFYDGSTLLGNDDTGPVYSYAWNSAPPGSHALTAVAWDNTGLAATSSVANVTVRLQQVEYVIVISVDGMGSAYVTPLLTNGLLNELTAFKQLQAEGAGTLNARDDADYAVTMPNHVTMMTSRGVATNANGHGWTLNDYPDGTNTTLAHKRGSYVASGFDVAHDNGLRTGIWAGKTKFNLFQQSYSTTSGALDATGPDNGQDKIDYDKIVNGIGAATLTTDFTNQMTASPFNFIFLHYQDADTTGHSAGWSDNPTNAFATTLKAVDTQIGKIMQMVTNSPTLQGKTAIILTADHGGHGTTHGDTTNPLDYTIPFYIWGPGVMAGGDLYAMNPTTRTAPAADSNPPYTGSQPVRNGDSANLAMALLGLEPVPGSTIGSATNKLAIAETPSVLGIVNNGDGSLTVTFAGTPGAEYRVLAATSLAPAGSWVEVSTNRASTSGRWTYTDNATPSSPERFFRAARP